ncbi:MAG: hypothetical protein ACK5C0_14825 [Candidatus Kapaibacterium sp.]|jgi:hypothetical protein
MTRTWRNADSLSQYNRIQQKNEYFWQNIEQSYTTISGRKNVDEVAGSETLDDALGFDGNREFGRLKPLGRGRTRGRYEPNNLVEEMAMKDAMDDPTLGRLIMDGQPMNDDR